MHPLLLILILDAITKALAVLIAAALDIALAALVATLPVQLL